MENLFFQLVLYRFYILYFNKMNNMLNKYPDGTGESGTSVPKPIDTGLVTNLESENRNSLKTENQLSLAVG